MTKRSVLFVCLGNICRSPTAEAIFLDLLKKSNRLDEAACDKSKWPRAFHLEGPYHFAWIVDSAGILDIHVGKNPYSRTVKTLHAHGITDYTHRARQVTSGDFSQFDYVFGLDEDNIKDLKSIEKHAAKNGKKAKLDLLGSYDPQGQKNVIDPYYINEQSAFETAFEHILRSCKGFLDHCYANQ